MMVGASFVIKSHRRSDFNKGAVYAPATTFNLYLRGRLSTSLLHDWNHSLQWTEDIRSRKRFFLVDHRAKGLAFTQRPPFEWRHQDVSQQARDYNSIIQKVNQKNRLPERFKR
jgi:hypothetical protein